MNKLLLCLCLISGSLLAQTTPKKRLIYYGYPLLVNSTAGNLVTASNTFRQYEYVVLEAGSENPSHGDHTNTATIINNIKNQVKVFGYVWLGRHLSNPTPWNNTQIRQKVDLWKAMGVHAIFLDDHGYSAKVRRVRQDSAVRYIHAQKLSVFANTGNADEVFGNTVTLPTILPVWLLL
ncbi:hypothetical protein [Runella zeae]|uniref:hypothetical protein n=1 Tax=Runella zeae TaxID=94255 RepID=UPI0004124DA9|nr:hypothetical protein [Runella zeae]